MVTLILALLIASFVCLVLAAFGVGGRINLIAVGLALFVLTFILPHIKG